jgi:ATP-dependent Lon protease
VKEVILPADNLKEIADLPQYVKDAVKLFPVNSLDQVIAKALLAAPVVAEVAE